MRQDVLIGIEVFPCFTEPSSFGDDFDRAAWFEREDEPREETVSTSEERQP